EQLATFPPTELESRHASPPPSEGGAKPVPVMKELSSSYLHRRRHSHRPYAERKRGRTASPPAFASDRRDGEPPIRGFLRSCRGAPGGRLPGPPGDSGSMQALTLASLAGDLGRLSCRIDPKSRRPSPGVCRASRLVRHLYGER